MVASGNDPWGWLAGTYWYVPTDNLLAYLFRPGSQQMTPVSDQTVFYISDSSNGYFWGNVTVQLGDQERSCYFLTGSVSPLGGVLLTFTPATDVTSQTTLTHGTGVMTIKDGKVAMLNQMASGPATLQVSHWAYMLQTVEGDAAWMSLPGVNVSVPEFISPCVQDAS
jgi:hypothetical protein